MIGSNAFAPAAWRMRHVDFLHRGISNCGKICINLLLARMRADRVRRFLCRLSPTVHFAFISLNDG
jgi:hypothetical protein